MPLLPFGDSLYSASSLEVLELLLRDQVVRRAARWSSRRPRRSSRSAWPCPARPTRAIDLPSNSATGLPKVCCGVRVAGAPRRRAHAGHLDAWVADRAGQLAAGRAGTSPSASGPVPGRVNVSSPFGDLDVLHRHRAAAAVQEQRRQRAAFVLHLEPVDVALVGRIAGDVPRPEERIALGARGRRVPAAATSATSRILDNRM